MISLKNSFRFASALLLTLAFTPSAYSENFRDRVYAEENSPMVLNDAQKAQLNDTQFIFVDGTFGEVFASNFYPALAVIHDEWPGAEAEVIRPHTPNPIPENAEIIFQQIAQFRANSQKSRAVIVAQSKGAAEVTLMALKHPELSTSLGVIAYGLVSGPMAGTDLVDLVESDCILGIPICKFLNQELPSLQTFTPDVIQPIFAEAIAQLTVDAHADFAAKAFYVQTQMKETDVFSYLYETHLYLRFHDHEAQNDGLIPTENEKLMENTAGGPQVLGTDLGAMIGDHNSLMNKASTRASAIYRQTFFRTLIERMLFGELSSGGLTKTL